jgi:hypothetical protein
VEKTSGRAAMSFLITLLSNPSYDHFVFCKIWVYSVLRLADIGVVNWVNMVTV